jgi:hypothetical protein
MGLVRGRLRRLARASIWGRTSVSAEDARLAGLLRYGLPGLDILLIMFGLFGFDGSIPALRDTFSSDYASWWGFILAVAAAVCFVGVAFPACLWRIEFAGKAVLIGLLVVYALAVFLIGGTQGDTGRAAVGWALLALCVLPVWRLFDIPRERKRHGWK